MTDEYIPAVDSSSISGEILVSDVSGVIHKVQTPMGVSDAAFRTVVASVSTWWNLHGAVPSVAEVMTLVPSMKTEVVSKIWVTEEFEQAIHYRGITFDKNFGLSLEQQYVLEKLSDPTDKRSLSIKLKEMNVPMPRYHAWLKHPLFKQALTKMSQDAYEDYLPTIRMALIGQAESGNMAAIQLVFDKMSEIPPKGLQDARTVVFAVLDSIIRNVTDTEVRAKIMADVQHAMVSYDVTNGRALGE